MKVSPTGLLLLITSLSESGASSYEQFRGISTGTAFHSQKNTAIVNRRSPFLVSLNIQEESLQQQDCSKIQNDLVSSLLTDIRGGDNAEESEYDYEDEEDEYDVEEDQEEEEEDAGTLSKSTLSATKKIKEKKAAQKTSKSKAAINASLQKTRLKKKKQRTSLLKKLRIPYIIRACMNPFTVIAMSKAYFASLFNINYLEEEDSSQGLRSALEAKAKQEAASGGKKGGRKGKKTMKPGRAKTLSDLPQLSA